MKYMFTLCSLFFLTTIYAHDIPVANFDISQTAKTLSVSVEIDQYAFKQAYTEKGQMECTQQEDIQYQMQDYLRSHFRLKVNGKTVNFQLKNMGTISHHYKIELKGNLEKEAIKQIDIQNTCLLADIPDQSNVITAFINDKKRGFRMTKERQAIQMKY
ncbi:MAG: DUF6702 family protein [Chitinophagales bacterium]